MLRERVYRSIEQPAYAIVEERDGTDHVLAEAWTRSEANALAKEIRKDGNSHIVIKLGEVALNED